jgi:hypothetical protein
VSARDIDDALAIALLAVASLHGEAQTKLDAAHHVDPARKECVIDAATDVGRSLNRVFAGILQREFGGESFRVRRITGEPSGETSAECVQK